MEQVKKITVGIFIGSVVVLTFLAILSVWDVLQKDVLHKSYSTIGIIGFAALIIIIAVKTIEYKNNS